MAAVDDVVPDGSVVSEIRIDGGFQEESVVGRNRFHGADRHEMVRKRRTVVVGIQDVDGDRDFDEVGASRGAGRDELVGGPRLTVESGSNPHQTVRTGNIDIFGDCIRRAGMYDEIRRGSGTDSGSDLTNHGSGRKFFFDLKSLPEIQIGVNNRERS